MTVPNRRAIYSEVIMSERKICKNLGNSTTVAKCVAKTASGTPERDTTWGGGECPTHNRAGLKIKSIEETAKGSSEDEAWNRICREFNEMEERLFGKKRRRR